MESVRKEKMEKREKGEAKKGNERNRFVEKFCKVDKGEVCGIVAEGNMKMFNESSDLQNCLTKSLPRMLCWMLFRQSVANLKRPHTLWNFFFLKNSDGTISSVLIVTKEAYWRSDAFAPSCRHACKLVKARRTCSWTLDWVFFARRRCTSGFIPPPKRVLVC